MSKPFVSRSLFLCCPAVPPVSDAGKVYDRYCPRDGVPQWQELHPQRPRRSQLHVSTISASALYTLGSCVLFHLLFLLKRSSKRTKSRATVGEREAPQKANMMQERHYTLAQALNSSNINSNYSSSKFSGIKTTQMLWRRSIKYQK